MAAGARHPVERPLLSLDPWTPEYEGAVQIDSTAENQISGEVDATIETSPWKALPATLAGSVPHLYFIDGVRRTEARVLASDQGKLVHGLFGVVGAGAVRVDGRQAIFDQCVIRRVLLLGCGYCHFEILKYQE